MSQNMKYMGGWGSRVPNKYMEFCPKNCSFFQKTKCSKQPKKQNKLNFSFSLSGVPNLRGGGWGPMFGTKSQKNVFFYTFPYDGLLSMTMTKTKTMTISMMCYPWRPWPSRRFHRLHTQGSPYREPLGTSWGPPDRNIVTSLANFDNTSEIVRWSWH